MCDTRAQTVFREYVEACLFQEPVVYVRFYGEHGRVRAWACGVTIAARCCCASRTRLCDDTGIFCTDSLQVISCCIAQSRDVVPLTRTQALDWLAAAGRKVPWA